MQSIVRQEVSRYYEHEGVFCHVTGTEKTPELRRWWMPKERTWGQWFHQTSSWSEVENDCRKLSDVEAAKLLMGLKE